MRFDTRGLSTAVLVDIANAALSAIDPNLAERQWHAVNGVYAECTAELEARGVDVSSKVVCPHEAHR